MIVYRVQFVMQEPGVLYSWDSLLKRSRTAVGCEFFDMVRLARFNPCLQILREGFFISWTLEGFREPGVTRHG